MSGTAVAALGLSAHFDLDAAEIGAIAIPDAESGPIKLYRAPVDCFQDCCKCQDC